MDYQEHILRPSEESTINKLKGHIIEAKGFLIEEMRKSNDKVEMKRIKGISKCLDQLDKALELID